MIKRGIMLLILGLGWLAAPTVFAHAELLSSAPAAGETVDESPEEVVLTFSETVTNSTIDLFTPGFARVDGIEVDESEAGDGIIRVQLPELDPEVYTVNWQVISADGHSILGSFEFGVAAPADAPAPDNNLPLLITLGTGVLVGVAIMVVTTQQRKRRNG